MHTSLESQALRFFHTVVVMQTKFTAQRNAAGTAQHSPQETTTKSSFVTLHSSKLDTLRDFRREQHPTTRYSLLQRQPGLKGSHLINCNKNICPCSNAQSMKPVAPYGEGDPTLTPIAAKPKPKHTGTS